MFYVNCYNRAERNAKRNTKAAAACKTTISEHKERLDAEFVCREAVLANPGNVYYITGKPCKNWEVA